LEGGEEKACCAEECYLGYHLAERCGFEELVFVRDVVVSEWFEIDGTREFLEG
jgi:hypothetical protein